MSETISIQFPDISGNVDTHTVFIRDEAGTLLNGAGDVISETGSTGLWTFTLAEARSPNTNYHVRVYEGTTETPAFLVYDDILYAGQTLVGKQFQAANKTTIRGTVGPTSPAITALTPSELSVSGASVNQWVGRILAFDNDTTTPALRRQ